MKLELRPTRSLHRTAGAAGELQSRYMIHDPELILAKLTAALRAFAMDDTCFFIAPIGEEGSEIRRRSDQVLKHLVRPAAESCGLAVTRADEIAEPGIITHQIIKHIISDRWVVADLTGRNPNVFYELAIRHAVRRPIVQLIEAGESIPFDVAGTRAIQVNHKDLDSVDRARSALVAAFHSLPEGALVDSPISAAVGLSMLENVQMYLQRMDELKGAISEVADLIGGRETHGRSGVSEREPWQE